MSLAEKALVSCGMVPAVWLLVQLHQAHQLLPASKPVCPSCGRPRCDGSSADPISSTHCHQKFALCPGDVSKASTSQDDAEEESQVQKRHGKGPRRERPYSTVMLIGISVDAAIIVVLSWAAQLVQLDVTSVMMQDDDIAFVLGKLLSLLNSWLVQLVLMLRTCISFCCICLRDRDVRVNCDNAVKHRGDLCAHKCTHMHAVPLMHVNLRPRLLTCAETYC